MRDKKIHKNFHSFSFQPFKRQLHKMVEHSQTIRRLLPTNCLNVCDHFVGLALKRLTGAIYILAFSSLSFSEIRDKPVDTRRPALDRNKMVIKTHECLIFFQFSLRIYEDLVLIKDP